MLKAVIEKALNKQIELEASSSQFYLSMASWTETMGLSGSSTFLYQHSDEERQHMLKLVKFINQGLPPPFINEFYQFQHVLSLLVAVLV